MLHAAGISGYICYFAKKGINGEQKEKKRAVDNDDSICYNNAEK